MKKILFLTIVLTYILIVLGSAVRVTDSGMSCPDWPTCYGQFFPFPQPEGGFVVGERTYHTWEVLMEWSHRFLASIVGGLVLAATVLAWKEQRTRAWAMAALSLLAIQIKLGGLTVWLNNIHWSVAIHLGCALLFLAAISLWRRAYSAQLSASFKANPLPAPACAHFLVWLAGLSTFATLLVGAMVSSSHAGAACGELFSCQGAWWPQADWHQSWHMLHRYLALGTTLVIFLFLWFSQTYAALKPVAKHLAFILLGQLALGVATLYSFSHYPEFYQPLSVAHLAWGTVLFLAFVGTFGKLYISQQGGFHHD